MTTAHAAHRRQTQPKTDTAIRASSALSPVRAADRRMMDAWMVCSQAEQHGEPVAVCEALFRAYEAALYAYIAAVRADMTWQAPGAGSGTDTGKSGGRGRR